MYKYFDFSLSYSFFTLSLRTMEMNRYLIAALYVMAGCAVAVPSKAQTGSELLTGERCRLVITHTVKVVSVYLEDDFSQQASCVLPPDFFHFAEIFSAASGDSFSRAECSKIGTLCRISHRIRAPGHFI